MALAWVRTGKCQEFLPLTQTTGRDSINLLRGVLPSRAASLLP
jgi:hypothetical protein